MQNEIIKLLPNQENYLIGFADLGELVKNEFPFQYAIVVGAKLDDSIINKIEFALTTDYVEHYHQKNDELNELVGKIAAFLTRHQIENYPVPATVMESELDEKYQMTLRYKFSHKMAATRAGLGWIGKTDLLISKKFGPRLRLATVLTNYRFENWGTPINKSLCGNCQVCVEKCPGLAANGKLWTTQTDRDEFFSAHKCRNACRKRAKEFLGKEISLCGICVAVCPRGRN